MSEWCVTHPWMTFFIALAIADSVRIAVMIGNRNRGDRKSHSRD